MVFENEFEKTIADAAHIIKEGGLVVYPTETIYGLGADPFNRISVLKVFGAKRRPFKKPLSVAVTDFDQMDELVFTNNAARRLSEAFMPGPLTIILKKKARLPKELTSRSEKLGIRIPDNQIALKFIEAAGPVTATSANVSGQPNPITAKDAKDQLGNSIDFILDGGMCKLGKPSTVVDLSVEGSFEILREGSITRQEIERVLNRKK